MSQVSGATSAGVIAAYAAMINAIKASGAIVKVEPNDFAEVLRRMDEPLVVYSPAGFFTKHKYLTSYKGLCFYTKSETQLYLPDKAELIMAKKIWVPE